MIQSNMPEYEQMLEAIKRFVAQQLGVDKDSLTEETRIEEGVSIAGLDAYVFYENFFFTFGIVNPSEFPVDGYVISEVPLRHLLKGIFSKSER